MGKMKLCALALVASVLAVGETSAFAEPYHPAFDPREIDDRPAGAPNEVMVLGTPHLSRFSENFRTEMTEPLVARLVEWRPTAVAVEDSSGLLCDKMRRMPKRYEHALRSYCFDPALANAATGLDVPMANERVEEMLADWPANPEPALRRELAAVFLAAGEPASALVQWLRLPEDEQRADANLTERFVSFLQKRATGKNETTSIAVKVAVGAGLERVWSVDDQSIYMGELADDDAYGEAMMGAWQNPAAEAQDEQAKALKSGLDQPDGFLAMYRAYNAPEYAMVNYRSDFGAALTEPSAEGYGRRYVASWEARNLRMVANMREVLGRKPGTRMLTIVGASHKGYYEAYLAQMRDVVLVDVMPVLE